METNEKSITADQLIKMAENNSKICDKNLTLRALFESIDAIIETHEGSTGGALERIPLLVKLAEQVSTEINDLTEEIDQILLGGYMKEYNKK